MSPFKNFCEATKAYFATVPFLQFLLTASIYIFALGALFYIVDLFVYTYLILSGIGRVLIFAGLILTVIKQDAMTLLITSSVISLACLIGWIVALAVQPNLNAFSQWAVYSAVYSYGFKFEPLIYFLGFGAIALYTGLKSERFQQIRAENMAKAQARAAQAQAMYAQQQQQYAQQQQQYAQQQTQQPVQQQAAAPAGNKCVKCGADLPPGAGFCGNCGSPQS